MPSLWALKGAIGSRKGHQSTFKNPKTFLTSAILCRFATKRNKAHECDFYRIRAKNFPKKVPCLSGGSVFSLTLIFVFNSMSPKVLNKKDYYVKTGNNLYCKI